MRLYFFLRGLLGWFMRRFMRFSSSGLENLPAEGPFIIAANHIHALDPVVVALHVPLHVSFMAKEEVMNSRLLGWLVHQLGSFTVKRGKADLNAIKQALKVLSSGNVLGIFPEGTRSKTGEMQAAFAGTALLAARAEVPIIPVALRGTYRWGGRVQIRIGEPFSIATATPGRPTPEERALGTEVVSRRIQDLLNLDKESEVTHGG